MHYICVAKNPSYQATGFLAPQLGVAPSVSLLVASSRTGLSPGVIKHSDTDRYVKGGAIQYIDTDTWMHQVDLRLVCKGIRQVRL